MSERTTRGRGGRKSKGARRPRTLRVPLPLDSEIEKAHEAAGYNNVNDFLLDIITRAHTAGLWPEPVTDQQRLPLGA